MLLIPRQEAEAAYEMWMMAPGVAASYAGDDDVKDGFVSGYMAALEAQRG